MKRALISFCFILSVSVCSAETAASAPRVVSGPSQGADTAKPNPAKPKVATEVLNTNKYPFAAAMKLLRSTDPARVKGGAASSVPSIATLRGGAAAPPTTRASLNPLPVVLLQRDSIPLSASQASALTLGQAVEHEATMTTLGKDGRVMFTYGVGLPTIICAPLRVSTVELQPGEKITGPPEIGDSTRWEIVPASSGSGDLVMPVLAIKPHAVGLETNLVVTTNKRVYYLRLISKPDEYIARTAFSYQEDEDKLWQQFLKKQEERTETEQARSRISPMAGDALDHLNFNYSIKGGPSTIRPIRVMDDGAKTYITMPPAAMTRELPAFVVENPKIKGRKGQEMVNYRVKDNVYIVDRLFDRGALILGTGKKADVVYIRRDASVMGGK